MKKRFNIKKSTGRKNALFALVALVLVMIMVVGVSYSWIEQISNVEFKFPDGEKNPMKISTKNLDQPAVSNLYGGDEKTIDLSQYFYEGGNMHLSSCYGDGNEFYFPKKAGTGSSIPTYRTGTKDDAEANYVSVSFTVKNMANYDQAFWFDYNTNKPIFSTGDSNVNPLLRSSFTITTADKTINYVFTNDSSKHYKTVENDGSVSTKDGKGFDEFKYDANHNNYTDTTTNTNYSSTRGANGNTVFTLDATSDANNPTTADITIKLWLEYDSSVNSTAVLSNINLRLVSCFTKTRTITFDDKSMYGEHSWFAGNSAELWMLLKDDTKKNIADNTVNEDYWSVPVTQTAGIYSVTIPAYLNGKDIIFLRCDPEGFGKGSHDLYSGGDIKYWNKWETTLPDTYDNRTYSELSPEWGTWGDPAKVHRFFFIDSENWGNADQSKEFANVWLWKHSTLDDENVPAVKNAPWCGERMYHAFGLDSSYSQYIGDNDNKGTISMSGVSEHRRIYTVFYDVPYDHVAFCLRTDAKYTSSHLTIPDSVDTYDWFYDLRSDHWFKHSKSGNSTDELGKVAIDPYLERVKIYGDWGSGWDSDNATDDNKKPKVMTRSQVDENVFYAIKYLPKNTTCWFHIKLEGTTFSYKSGQTFWDGSNNTNISFDNNNNCFKSEHSSRFVDDYIRTARLASDGTSNVKLVTSVAGYYTFRFYKNDQTLAIDFPVYTAKAGGSTTSDATPSSAGYDSMTGFDTNSDFTVQVSGQTYRVKQNSSGTEFKVELPLAAGDNWVTFQANSYNYGLSNSSQFYNVPSTGLNLCAFKFQSNNFSFYNTEAAGDYIVAFTYDNGNHNTIRINSVLQKASGS